MIKIQFTSGREVYLPAGHYSLVELKGGLVKLGPYILMPANIEHILDEEELDGEELPAE